MNEPRWASRAILLLALMVAFVNGVRNPLFESPDELLHYRFVRYLLDEGRLPVQPEDRALTQYHQPPLYYAGGALLVAAIDDPQVDPLTNPFWLSYKPDDVHKDNKAQFLPQATFGNPFRGTALVVHVLRMWSLLLLAGILWGFKMIAAELWPDHPRQQALFLAVAGLNPMLLYIGSSINNDNLVVLFGTLLLWYLVRSLLKGFSRSHAIVLGVLWGAATLSKLSGLLLFAPVALALLWLAYRDRRWRQWLAAGIVALLVGLLLHGWWFGRNVALYGELFGLERMLDIWGERVAGERDLPTIVSNLAYAHETFWGRFGYGQIVLPDIHDLLFIGLTLLGVAGFVIRARQITRASQDLDAGVWLVLAGAALVFLAAFAYFMWRNPSGANGRYIYPALAAYAAFIATGLARLPRPRLVGPLTILLMGASALFALGWLVPWTYAAPGADGLQRQGASPENAGELSWEPGMKLLGAALKSRDVSAMENPEAELNACWQAQGAPQRNYVFYVHVVDQEQRAIGRRDTHTGLGNYPTSLWQPGDVFCETYRVPLDSADLVGPQIADVTAGFYDAETREALPALTDDGAPLTYVVLDQIKVSSPQSSAGPVESPLGQFEEGISLLSYEWLAATAAPGMQATVRLQWTATGPTTTSYTVFAHLLDAGGQLLAQDDQIPVEGAYPTQFWGEGEVIADEHIFEIPADAPAGPSTLRLGFYRLSDNGRLLRVDDGRLPDAVELPGPTISP